MPSLLDLPDEVLFVIGERFEYDPPNLGLFLLIHPRVNAACTILRYRTKYVRFDSQSPLQGYLQNKLWLQNVHEIGVFAGCFQRYPNEGYWGRMGYQIKEPERFDQDLAEVIGSLSSLKVVRLEVPVHPSLAPGIPTIPLKQTMKAIKSHNGIQEVRMCSFRTEEQLHLALDLALSSPDCSVLELSQERDTSIDADLLTPIVDYLSTPSVAGKLKTLYLREVGTFAPEEDDDEAFTPVELLQLPCLEYLYMQDGWLWHEGERELEVSFLREIMLKARRLVRLDINAMALLALGAQEVDTTATVLHLLCGTEDLTSLDDLLSAIPSSIHTLILSGMEAPRCAKTFISTLKGLSSSESCKVEKLTIIGAWNSTAAAEEMDKLKVLAEKQGIALAVTAHFTHPAADHGCMANPVNPKNWTPRPLQLAPGLMALGPRLGPVLVYPAEERGL